MKVFFFFVDTKNQMSGQRCKQSGKKHNHSNDGPVRMFCIVTSTENYWKVESIGHLRRQIIEELTLGGV